MGNTAIVNSKELGARCWLAARFCDGKRCHRVMDCDYPEKETCKAVQAEKEYLRAHYTSEMAKLGAHYAKAMQILGEEATDDMYQVPG